jgi:glucans biosynthesis protein
MPGWLARLHTPLNRPDVFDELVAFQQSASGPAGISMRSARGLAINTGLSAEEFAHSGSTWKASSPLLLQTW